MELDDITKIKSLQEILDKNYERLTQIELIEKEIALYKWQLDSYEEISTSKFEYRDIFHREVLATKKLMHQLESKYEENKYENEKKRIIRQNNAIVSYIETTFKKELVLAVFNKSDDKQAAQSAEEITQPEEKIKEKQESPETLSQKAKDEKLAVSETDKTPEKLPEKKPEVVKTEEEKTQEKVQAEASDEAIQLSSVPQEDYGKKETPIQETSYETKDTKQDPAFEAKHKEKDEIKSQAEKEISSEASQEIIIELKDEIIDEITIEEEVKAIPEPRQKIREQSPETKIIREQKTQEKKSEDSIKATLKEIKEEKSPQIEIPDSIIFPQEASPEPSTEQPATSKRRKKISFIQLNK